MTIDTNFSIFGIGFDIDPVTGISVDTGLVGVDVSPIGSTSVDIVGSQIVDVDLTTGTTVDVLGSEIIDIGLTESVVVDVAEATASVEVAEIPVEADLIESVLFGVGEELLFADLNEVVTIATNLLASGVDISTLIDVVDI